MSATATRVKRLPPMADDQRLPMAIGAVVIVADRPSDCRGTYDDSRRDANFRLARVTGVERGSGWKVVSDTTEGRCGSVGPGCPPVGVAPLRSYVLPERSRAAAAWAAWEAAGRPVWPTVSACRDFMEPFRWP